MNSTRVANHRNRTSEENCNDTSITTAPTEFSRASFIGNPAVVETLLQKCGGTSPPKDTQRTTTTSRGSVLWQYVNGRNALHLVVAGGNIEAVNLLLKDASTGSQAKMAQDNGGKTPSQFAEECE
ncbi:hypothetical protein Pelo_19257 [Pelomyxa schiedti]|nr:hypothetical protein Pelo_19257 [Pelomyxa schiedti]